MVKKVYTNGSQTDKIHYVFEGTEPIFEKRISDEVFTSTTPIVYTATITGNAENKFAQFIFCYGNVPGHNNDGVNFYVDDVQVIEY